MPATGAVGYYVADIEQESSSGAVIVGDSAMITKTRFRILVLVALATAIAGRALDLWASLALPPEVQTYWAAFSQEPFELLDIVALAVVGVGYAFGFATAVGFWLFWRPARLLALLATILILIGEMFVHPLMQTGLGHLLREAAAILWGVIVACAFASLISDFFEGKRSNK